MPAAKKPRHGEPQNALDEMMQSAKEPGAFESPINVKALQRNVLLSQIVAEVLNESGAEKDADSSRSSGSISNEDDTGCAMDPALKRASMRLYDDTPDSDDDTGFYDDDKDDDEEEEEEERRIDIAEHTAFSPLKPPPDTPPNNSPLTAITVHFSRDSYDKVFGFTFFYSNGVEICVGETRDTIEIEMRLTEGEHVVGVQPLLHRHRDSHHYFVKQIRFRTSKGRQVVLKRERGEQSRQMYYQEKTNVKSDYENELTVDPSKVLRSIEWCDETLTIKCLHEVALADIADLADSSIDRVPSLFTLAREKHESWLLSRAERIEKDRCESLHTLRSREKEKVEQVYKAHRQELNESKEAAMVWQLRSLLSKAESKLNHRSMQLLKSANTQRNTIMHNISLERSKVETQCGKRQQQVMDDRRMFAGYGRSCSDSNSADDNDALSLCISPGCGKTFRANNLPKHKRCGTVGCTFSFVNCGCLLTPCSVCHDYPFCPRHFGDHRDRCERSAHRKCGCLYDDELHPAGCHKESVSLEECVNCAMNCCPDCLERCACIDSPRLTCPKCSHLCSKMYHDCEAENESYWNPWF